MRFLFSAFNVRPFLSRLVPEWPKLKMGKTKSQINIQEMPRRALRRVRWFCRPSGTVAAQSIIG
jgi:hypothetical protein